MVEGRNEMLRERERWGDFLFLHKKKKIEGKERLD